MSSFKRRLRRANRPRPVTVQELATGQWEKRLPHPRRLGPSSPVPYVDLVNYLVTRGYCRTRSEARAALVHGRVNVNGKVWAYPHVPKNHIGHDDYGRPRVMVEGVPDPRPVQ